ncbi:6-phosphogluconate dehydrogenase [Robiginitalea aurantiaca]|uniref:6-phosphogluconate dehydrogenase n=1 Tax=Robiginitalea aurantiaca TaxID=3056915 RepID=A0ABT7WCD4_9FLAO|nr:6-phosphogluconate dehydrogenase [Robiginitalea aurantiaca]MDM9630566.1 6-phosphogluconate dehydrogenase [Robiginitalea aurantiaca]
MFKSILYKSLGVLALMITGVFLFLYYVTYSEGTRSGELIKFSNKGVLFKTWEGEISQGISGAQIFRFSILDRDKEVIEAMKAAEGQYIKVNYEERFTTFPWWGDSKYFITDVEISQSPHRSKYGSNSP